jgi:hypothetical protein
MPPRQVSETKRGKIAPITSDEAGTGARHHPTYVDTQAEYVAVRKSDLRDISQFGWLEEGAGAVGVFFISGAFWLAITLCVEHSDQLAKYLFGFIFCGICILFGVVLVWIAHSHFKMRRTKIEGYFTRRG